MPKRSVCVQEPTCKYIDVQVIARTVTVTTHYLTSINYDMYTVFLETVKAQNLRNSSNIVTNPKFERGKPETSATNE